MKKRKIAVLLMVLIMFAMSAFPSLAGVWKQDVFGWWYVNEDGSIPTSSWLQIGEEWYYFRDSGYMATGPIKVGDKEYYLYESGAMAADTWLELRSDWYYFNADGSMAKSCWIGDNYYVGADGAMVKNRWIDGVYIDEDGEGEHPEEDFFD